MIFVIDLFYRRYYIDCINITTPIPPINPLAAQVENLQIYIIYTYLSARSFHPEYETKVVD